MPAGKDIWINGDLWKTYYDTGPQSVTPQLPIAAYMTREYAIENGWKLEYLHKQTPPSAKYPAGRFCWASLPLQPASWTTIMERLALVKAEMGPKIQTYRARNVYDGSVVMQGVI